MLDIIANPRAIASYDMQKPGKALNGTSIVDPAESYDYVIITTENEPAYHCDGTYGDGCTIPEFNDTAAHIRNFIKDAYQNWGIKYVLLGGDGDGADVGGESEQTIIPARGFYGFVNNPGDENDENDNISADLYYAALDGSWNSDLDDWWGEPGEAEVFVGRAPVDSEEELSNFVNKTIGYEKNANAPYLKKALMVGEALNTTLHIWGGDYKDEVMEGSYNNGYHTL